MSDPVVVLTNTSDVVITKNDDDIRLIGDSQGIAGAPGLGTPAGRLTLTSGVAVTTADVAGAISIFYTPAAGDKVQIFDGSSFIPATFTEITLALDPTSGHTGYHQSGKIFDLFVINSGTIRLATGPAWTSDTVRGTGAGTTELELKNGFWTNKNALAAARFGSASGNTVAVPANQGTYVGSFRASADGQASDTVLARILWNNYQRAKRIFRRADPASSWNYSTAAFRQVNANVANKVGILAGLGGGTVEATMLSIANSSAATVRNVYSGIGIDSTTVNSAPIYETGQATNAVYANPRAEYIGQPGMGYHEIVMLEQGAGADTQGWLGAGFASGLLGTCES